jgi:hypothetical protein
VHVPVSVLEGLSRLSMLEVLDLSHSSANNETVRQLQHLPCLRDLGLAATHINDGALASLHGLSHLTHLDISETKITGTSAGSLSWGAMPCCALLAVCHDLAYKPIP